MLDSVVSLLDEASVIAEGKATTPIVRLYSAFSSVHACQVDTFEMVERAIVDGEPLADIVQMLLHRHAEENSALVAYFEQLPLSGESAAAQALADAIAHASRDPRALRARSELAHAAVISLLAVKRGARQVADARAGIDVTPG